MFLLNKNRIKLNNDEFFSNCLSLIQLPTTNKNCCSSSKLKTRMGTAFGSLRLHYTASNNIIHTDGGAGYFK
jgi:hypothetical protein